MKYNEFALLLEMVENHCYCKEWLLLSPQYQDKMPFSHDSAAGDGHFLWQGLLGVSAGRGRVMMG